jgi:hypothetical protein
MKKTLLTLSILLILFVCNNATAQRKPMNVGRQVDSRFTLSAESNFSTLGGWEEYFYYVKNNTSQEYSIVVTIDIDLACVGSKSYVLGINKTVYLPPNGSFTPKSDWVHSVVDGPDNFRKCRMKVGDTFTLYKGLTFTITDVINLTEKKAAEAKKKADEAAAKQAEADKKKADAEALAKKKADDASAKKLADEQAAAKQKETAAAAATTKTTTAAGATAAAATTSSAAGAAKSTNSESAASLTPEEKAEAKKQKQEDAAAAQREAKEEAARQEAERKQKEQEELNNKQQAYDEWKAEKKKEQSEMETAAAASSFTILTMVGGILYDGMGDINPDFVFKNQNQLAFYAGIDMGFSAVAFPTLFASDKSTMVGGKSSTKIEVQPKDLYHVNLNVTAKIGAEHPYYGFYGYLAPQVGFSPYFDGYNFSPLNGGGTAFLGLKWVKGFVDYGVGTRAFSSSSNDAEEAGSGNTEMTYTKLTYGIKFTTNPDRDFTRNHILLGVIDEKVTVDYDQAFVDPTLGYLVKKAQSKSIRGYTFQWKKDHTFNFYVNAYPEYVYAGEVKSTAGGLSSDFSTKKTGLFVEVGFLRSIDFW